ncbi:MAG: efflux RND transporter periplasmic adaptor subunit [Vibrionaceae bacterium]
MNDRIRVCFVAMIFFAGPAAHAQKPLLQPAVDVITQKVVIKPVERRLRLVGNVKSQNSVTIVSEVSGKVDAIYVKTGQQVKKGQLLLSINGAKTKALLAEATAFYNDEQRKLTEFKQLYRKGALTKTNLDAQQASVDIAQARLEVTKLNVRDHSLQAPFSGTIGLIDINVGQFVNMGQSLLTLDDLTAMQLDVKVPEQYLPDLRGNVMINVYSKVWPSAVFAAQLEAIDSRVEQNSLNFRARINLFPNAMPVLPGMLMEAEINFTPRMAKLVPAQSVEYLGSKRFVYKVLPDQTVRRTEVKLGGRFDQMIQVDSGVQEGDPIVVQGLVSLKDGMAINDLTPKPADLSQGGGK